MAEIDDYKRKSKQGAFISLFGFIIIVFVFAYSAIEIKSLQEEKAKLEEEKISLIQDIEKLESKKVVLGDEYKDLLLAFGWHKNDVDSVGVDDPRFLEAVQATNEIHDLLGFSIVDKDNLIDLDLYNVEFTEYEEDFADISEALTSIGLYVNAKAAANDETNSEGINHLMFGKDVPYYVVRLVACSLIRVGVPLEYISRVENAHPIRNMVITSTPNNSDCYIKLEDIMRDSYLDDVKSRENFF